MARMLPLFSFGLWIAVSHSPAAVVPDSKGAAEVNQLTLEVWKAIVANDTHTFDFLTKDEWFDVVAFDPMSLRAAVTHHNLHAVSVLLAHGADINAGLVKGNTALADAVLAGDPKMVRYLLEQGADPFGIDELHFTAVDTGLISAETKKRTRTDCVLLILDKLKKDGKLDLYRRYESILAEMRGNFPDDKQKVPEIDKLVEQMK